MSTNGASTGSDKGIQIGLATVPLSFPSGFGAAKHLSEQGYGVTLLEASPNPGGLATGWRTATGREVEAGMKGMWYEVRSQDLL